MKTFIKFLDQNNINYKIVKYGNFLYIPAKPIEGLNITIEPDKQPIIENYLKKHKKYYFESKFIYSSCYQEYLYKVFNKNEYKQFLNISNYDQKLRDKFNLIYHYEGKEAAEKFYKKTMLKYNEITA